MPPVIHHQDSFPKPIRLPQNVLLLQNVLVSDFNYTARIQVTTPSLCPQELCVVFGYQDPSHYYYIHLDERGDGRADGIFVVDGSSPKLISRYSTLRTPWNDGEPHRVRVERNTQSGSIRFYLDDLERPIMEADDKTFLKGLVGTTSFERAGKVDEADLKGVSVKQVGE